MTEIDQNLYSRQIGAFGMEMMKKLVTLDVLICGLKGVGVEAAKNLILAGPRSVTLHDDVITSIYDANGNFYLTERVGVSRAQGSAEELSQLNPYVKVSVISGNLTDEVLKNFRVIFVSEMPLKEMLRINNFCRENNIKFIACDSIGVAGYVFTDFGKEFYIFDKDGVEPRQGVIANVTQGNPGVVSLHEDKRHGLEDGDSVVFSEIEGMTELNSEKLWQVKITGPCTFEIGDISSFSPYQKGGLFKQVKVEIKKSYKSLEERLENPVNQQIGMLMPPDMSKFGRSEQLHFAFRAIWEFESQTGHRPRCNNLEDAAKVIEIAKQLNQEAKTANKFSVESIQEDVVQKVALYSTLQISPFAAFFGGIAAQEIVKATGKFTPLEQWLHFDSFEILPDKLTEGDIQACPYHDYKIILGQEAFERLYNAKIFMIGAGALGCEFLKGFALMGLGCGPQGKVTVTDDDKIEVSNLNRQFLFRQENVGQYKALAAIESVKKMNKNLKAEGLTSRCAPEFENVFIDEFWDELTFVVNAVDNVKARQYSDSKCLWHGKPLLESGTLGTRANVQVIIPYKTQSYKDTPNPPEEHTPMCTIRNFPFQIEHCIEWARSEFEGQFTDSPKDVLNFLMSKEEFLDKAKKEKNPSIAQERLEKVRRLLKIREGGFDACVQQARLKFQEYYTNAINQLLHNFPKDYKDQKGNLFWSGAKRCPEPVVFDLNDQNHVTFVVAYSNLLANTLGIPQNKDINYIKQFASSVQVPQFQPKQLKMDEKNEIIETSFVDISGLVAEFQQMNINPELQSHFKEEQFEKDDDSNWHIDFITACSNLRAKNYNIQQVDRLKTKLIAGKIIPAIATTTAMITGLVLLEGFKLIQGKPIDAFRNAFTNLALPFWVQTQLVPPKKTQNEEYDPVLMGPVRAVPEGFSSWDKIEVRGPFTVQQFKDYFTQTQKQTVQVIAIENGSTALYNSFESSHSNYLNQQVHELWQQVTKRQIPAGKKSLCLDLGVVSQEDNVDLRIPVVKYFFS